MNQAQVEESFNQAIHLVEKREFAGAINQLKTLEQVLPINTVYNLLAHCQVQVGQAYEAALNFKKSLEMDRSDTAARDLLCNLLELHASEKWATYILSDLRKIFPRDRWISRLLDRTSLLIEKFAHLSDSERASTINSSLHTLGRRHGTDKSNTVDVHTYAGWSHMDIYESYFKPFRNKAINYLEIGVLRGESLRTFEEYFPLGQIYGLDINPECKAHEKGRVNITIGSQGDHNVLEELCKRSGGFDIVLDDGSHATEHMQVSFETLFPHVRSGGLYIIEDLACTYGESPDMSWPGMHYNTTVPKNDREAFEAFYVKKIREMDAERGDILSIHFWYNIAIIMKKQLPKV